MIKQTNPGRAMADMAIAAANDIKAREIVCLDVAAMTSMTDYMVIASGSSSRHVKSIAETVLEKMKSEGYKPVGVEGLDAGEWVLVDFGSVILHVLGEEARKLYALEKLWTPLPDGTVTG